MSIIDDNVGSSSSSSVTLIVAMTPLLSGGLDACQSITDVTCEGGVAALAAYARYYADDSDVGCLIIPRLDYQSAFVQMHPLAWAVNRIVYQYRYQWPVYWAFASLFSQHKDDSAVANRDLTDLLTQEFTPLLSNVAVPASNSWSELVKHIYFHKDTGLAVMVITHFAQVFSTPGIETTQGLLRYISLLNKRAGCVLPDNHNNNNTAQTTTNMNRNTPFEDYATARNLTWTKTQCWIPVLIITGYDPEGFSHMIETLAHDANPPQVILDISGNQENYTEATLLANSTTWVYSKAYREGSFVQQRLYLNQDGTRVINMTIVDESITEIQEDVKDDQFAADIEYMRNLAKEAVMNDPVVGLSQEMPVVRDSPLTPCRGGECPAGNLFADALRWKANASVAFINSGGVRGDGWPRGEVRMSDIWNTFPFANTLCEATMSGLSLFRLFNFSTSLATFQGEHTAAGDRLFQVSGVRITYNTLLNTSRLVAMDVWDDTEQDYTPVERLQLYKIATSSWECSGFDIYPDLLGSNLTVQGEQPSFIFDDLLQNIVGDYLAQLDPAYYNTSIQGRLVNDTTALTAMNWMQSEDTCPQKTYWDAAYLTCFECPSTSEVLFLKDVLEVDGVSGLNGIMSLEATVVNSENFTVSLLSKQIPEWLVWNHKNKNGGFDDDPTVLEPLQRHTFLFSATASDLDAGTAQAVVSFAVQHGGSFEGCTSDDVTFEVFMRVAPQPELNNPESITIVGFVLMTLACLLSMGLALWVFWRRNTYAVKARQPEFLIQLCFGTFVLALAILPLSIVDELSSWHARNQACMALPWLVFMGFHFVMSALCMKLWRINKLLNATTLRRVTVTMTQAYYAFGILIAAQLLTLVVWTVVDPMKWETLHVPGEEWNRFGSCSEMGTWGWSLLGLSGALSSLSLLLTAHQAFKARNISDEYSESRDLGFAVFTVAQIVIVGVPILCLVRDDNPDATYLLQTLIIFAVCLSVLVLIFGPMMCHIYQEQEPQSSSIGRTTLTGVSASMIALMRRTEQESAVNQNAARTAPDQSGAMSGHSCDTPGVSSGYDTNGSDPKNSGTYTL